MGRTPVSGRRLSREDLRAISAVSRTGAGNPGGLIQGKEDNQVFGAVAGGDTRQDADDLGGGSHLSQPGGEGVARRILLEQLPGYAPELNPDEGVWGYLKRVEMRDVAAGTVAQGVLGGAETAEQALSAVLLHQGSGFTDSFTHL